MLDQTISNSPCIKVCHLEPASGFCVGCGRDIGEIAGWSGLTPQARRAVLDALPTRLATLAGAAKGD